MNGRGMWAVTAAIAGTLVGLAMLVTGSSAAVDAPLSGKFLATVKTVKASFPVEGGSVERNYRFKCLNKRCTKAQFKREAGDGVYKSKLTEKKQGVYKGTEKDADSDCPDADATGKRKTAHKVKVVKASKSGMAQKLKGTANYVWPGCDGDPSQKTKFTAVRK